MNNLVIELENNSKYIVIDMLDYLNKKYFLLAKLNDTNINDYFDIVAYNDDNNYFEPLEDEFLYDTIKAVFENKLNYERVLIDSISN